MNVCDITLTFRAEVTGVSLAQVEEQAVLETGDTPRPSRECRTIESFSNPEISYIVTLFGDNPVSCNCPDFVYRLAHTGGDCKHMRAV